MLSNQMLIDAFERVKEVVHEVTEGLSMDELAYRPAEPANSIAWLIWHLTRIQDDHIADMAHTKQLWHSGWSKRFALPFDDNTTGYEHTSEEVATVKASAEMLLQYYDAVHGATIAYLEGLQEKDYAKIVDVRWNPPVTLAVRVVSIIADDLQHAGQAAYVRGLLLASHVS